jgi:hypothetical protein
VRHAKHRAKNPELYRKRHRELMRRRRATAHAETRKRSLPEPLEPASRHARVADSVARIAVAQIVLHGPQVGAAVGQIVAAGMPERGRMHVLEPGAWRDQAVCAEGRSPAPLSKMPKFTATDTAALTSVWH